VIGERQRAISGSVKTADGTGVAGATVGIHGPTAGTVRTNRDGSYYAVVDPGDYQVAVAGTGGRASKVAACNPGHKSGSACRLSLSHADGQADFQVGCTGEGPTADRGARAASAGGCELDVAVKVVSSNHAGLGYAGAPAFYTGSSTASRCLSGCIELQITVTDKTTHQAPPLGTGFVSARVTPISTGMAPYPSAWPPGTGHLCSSTSGSVCGDGTGVSRLNNLLLDASGQATLRYWAPGIADLKGARVNARVDATETCSPAACRTGHKQGQGN
jgi:hypothetical protein